MTGNTYELAKVIADGCRLEGAEVDIRRFPETMSDEALKKWGITNAGLNELFKEVPVIGDQKEFASYDAYFFGTPTFSCTIAPQIGYYFSTLGDIWMTAACEGKLFSVFSSVSEQQGGGDTSKLDLMGTVLNLGMLFVGFPPSFEGLTTTTKIHGVSKLGAGTISGGKKDDKKPNELEEKAARYAGQHLAKLTKKMFQTEINENSKK